MIKLFLILSLIFVSEISESQTTEPYTIELQQISMPGTPAIHSFSFAESGGKWLFIGGRTNGMHGFSTGSAFPKQYSNKNIFVVDPVTSQTWSRNIFTDIPFTSADPLRSTNMQYYQSGNKLYMIGGYGYDSTSNSLVTFPSLSVFDVEETIQAVVSGSSVLPYFHQVIDNRIKVCGGELIKVGDFFYLAGGHDFNGEYSNTVNNQVYTNQIKKFKIIDNGSSISLSEYSSVTDTVEFHRRDMNLVPAVKPDGVSFYSILYGGVFKQNVNLPYLNPVYIDQNGYSVDFSFEQKMSQYTCSNLTAFNSNTGSMHTTFFGGTSLYYYDESAQMQVYDSLVPFIDDITTLTRFSNGTSSEKISSAKFPALLGTNAKFIADNSIPKYGNGVIKLSEVSGRTFAGYIFGGIRAMFPNNTVSFPSNYIFRVFITPNTINVSSISSEIPEGYSLLQNYPNPFNPLTKIRYSLPESKHVSLKVYDALGQEVVSLVNERQSAGSYEASFDAGINNFGNGLSGGIYFYKLTTDNFSDSKKMILIK